MVRGAAGNDIDLVEACELLVGDVKLVKRDALRRKPALEQALDGLGLLGNLLGHEVGPTAQARRGGVPVDMEDLGRDRGTLGIDKLDGAIGAHAADLAVCQHDHVMRHAEEHREVRGARAAAFRARKHQRRSLARDDNLARELGAYDGERVGALDLRDRLLHSGHEVALVGCLDKVDDHLGVGVARKTMSLAHEALAKLGVVFDDAVVHDGEVARAVAEGMGVALGRNAVRGPTRMGDTGAARHGICLGRLLKHFHAALAANAAKNLVLRDDGQTRRVVPAILKCLEALEKKRLSLIMAYISDNAAHGAPPLERARCIQTGWRNRRHN